MNNKKIVEWNYKYKNFNKIFPLQILQKKYKQYPSFLRSALRIKTKEDAEQKR